MNICSRCILDSHIPKISFNANGECSYCQLHDKWDREYPIQSGVRKMISKVKRMGKNQEYDCVVGVSGGRDSSYLLHLTKEWGLHPLAVHWDNGWNTTIAEANMQKLVKALNVDFYRAGVDKQEYDDICKSFLLASVPDADIPNDIALATTLYYAAETFGTKIIFIGHSFRTEGTTPLGWSYMDGRYVESVHKKFGNVEMKTFPNLWLRHWLHWIIDKRIRMLRPLWHVNYQEEETRNFLQGRFGWKWYGGKHCENKYTKFVSNYLQPRKFGIDLRYIRSSALVRSGQLTREEALEKVEKPPEIEPAILKEVKQRLGFTSEEFERMMQAPKKTHNDYPTYHSTFRRWRLLFWMLCKANLVPKTFYEKYMRSEVLSR